jgi:hypothetical protein
MYHIRNEEIRTELKMYAIQDKITEYRIRWSAHLQRMDNSRWTADVGTGDSPVPSSDDDDNFFYTDERYFEF